MNARPGWELVAPLAVCVLLAGWIALYVANAQAPGFSILAFVIANQIVYTDALDFLLRLYMRRRHAAGVVEFQTSDPRNDISVDLGAIVSPDRRLVMPASPYAIIASIYNLEDQVEQFIEAFKPYRDRVWLVSDASTDNTVLRLTQAGWRCFDDGINRRKPGAIRRLLERIPRHIETIIVIDPDVRIRGLRDGSVIDLNRFVSDFQQSKAAAACPRIMIEPDGWLARFQAFEYALSFCAGRRSLADFSVTSGCSIYRRSALTRALNEHSLSVYAEDLENAVILLSQGERIYYDGRLVVSTEGPGSVARWFSQRVGWYQGLLKVYLERFPEVLRISRRSPFAAYHYLIYTGGLSIALHLIRVVSAAALALSLLSGVDAFLFDSVISRQYFNPEFFAAAMGSYLGLGVIVLFTSVPKTDRAYAAPIVPLYLCYAIVHVVPITLGFANYFALKYFRRRIYQDHYETAVGLGVVTQKLEFPT
ncbi:MAG TPA: glycosyltransferase family 2 protein [Steroidobacteraceae bacterium]|jgi:cellulose synthase/poly-beta-1,6-N-acetylglucosamine synthase-like glycosyltransferase